MRGVEFDPFEAAIDGVVLRDCSRAGWPQIGAAGEKEGTRGERQSADVRGATGGSPDAGRHRYAF